MYCLDYNDHFIIVISSWEEETNDLQGIMQINLLTNQWRRRVGQLINMHEMLNN